MKKPRSLNSIIFPFIGSLVIALGIFAINNTGMIEIHLDSGDTIIRIDSKSPSNPSTITELEVTEKKIESIKNYLEEERHDQQICSDDIRLGPETNTDLYAVSVMGDDSLLNLVQNNICQDAFISSDFIPNQETFIQVATFQEVDDAIFLSDTFDRFGLESNVNEFKVKPIEGEERVRLKAECDNVSIPAAGSYWCNIEDTIF